MQLLKPYCLQHNHNTSIAGSTICMYIGGHPTGRKACTVPTATAAKAWTEQWGITWVCVSATEETACPRGNTLLKHVTKVSAEG